MYALYMCTAPFTATVSQLSSHGHLVKHVCFFSSCNIEATKTSSWSSMSPSSCLCSYRFGCNHHLYATVPCKLSECSLALWKSYIYFSTFKLITFMAICLTDWRKLTLRKTTTTNTTTVPVHRHVDITNAKSLIYSLFNILSLLNITVILQ